MILENKKLFIIAGCNGAGKTTASYTILPEILECKEFVNADEIARGLSPFQPETVSFEAGRIMLNRIDNLLHENTSFALETTLSTKIYRTKILNAQFNGYQVILLFFWLKNIDLAKERVRIRVLEGGHNIPEDVIERRYLNGITNLFDIYVPIVDEVLIFDNSEGNYELIAEKRKESLFAIVDQKKFNQMKIYYDQPRNSSN